MSAAICTTCKAAAAKYKCPACPSNTCSLQCSKSHKITAPCSGKRNPVEFIPKSKFDDASINNDYNFLTTLERDLDNAARLSRQNVGGGGSVRHINQVRSFAKRAQDVGEVTLVMAPRGMKRARMNRSSWTKGQISWTVEWVLDGTTRKISDRVLDTTTIRNAVAFHKDRIGAVNASFRDAKMEDLNFLIRNEVTGQTQISFARLDPDKTLGEAVRHRTVVEFPTIYVYSELPEDIVLEREYAYTQSITARLPQSLLQSTHCGISDVPGNDFISLSGMEEDNVPNSRSPIHGEVQPGELPASKLNSTSSLPCIDMDDLELPI